MRIFVFGGDGFVGKFLSEELANLGNEVIICDINHTNNHEVYKKCSYQKIDIRNYNELSSLNIEKNDLVINLAANQYHNKIPKNAKDFFFLTNVEGTRNILNYLSERECSKFIMYSTDMTYGLPQYIPVDINHQQKPFGYYGESKLEAEKICKDFRTKGIRCTIFRPRIIVGPGRLGILKKLFLLINHSLPLPLIGSGNNHYQMISVFDCVSATVAAINKGIPNEEYNLGSLNPPTIKVLLSSFIKEVHSHSILIPTWGYGVKTLLSILNILGIHLMYKEQYQIADAEYLVDITKTMNDLNWEPKFSDEKVIKMAYDYYINNY